MQAGRGGQRERKGCCALPGWVSSPVDGADFGWHHWKAVAAIRKLPVFRTGAFPTASHCRWGPPVCPPSSSPHGIGAPMLIFHLILEILTPGSEAEGLCCPPPPRIKAAPLALAARVPARYSHHSPLAFKGLLCEWEYVATSVCRLQHAEVLLTAALRQKDQNRGREGRGGGSPPSLDNLNFMRKQRQIMERRDGGRRTLLPIVLPAGKPHHGTVTPPLPAAIIPGPAPPCPHWGLAPCACEGENTVAWSLFISPVLPTAPSPPLG